MMHDGSRYESGDRETDDFKLNHTELASRLASRSTLRAEWREASGWKVEDGGWRMASTTSSHLVAHHKWIVRMTCQDVGCLSRGTCKNTQTMDQ